jgi:YfiH family protein
MPFHQPDKVRYLTFDSLETPEITHAVFTRIGGVSPKPWDELNVGLTVGDDPKNVVENRRRSFEAVGRDIHSLSDSWLVHGTGVVVYDTPRTPEQTPPPQADIVLTDKPEVTLYMRCADCVPIIYFDPVNKAVGLAHAGWLGTVKQTAGAAVEAMQARYGTKPEDLLTVIGPSIGPERYEVGLEVVQAVQQAFGDDSGDLLPRYGQSTHFDLWAANRLTLERAGVRHIEVAGMCTSAQNDLWYSHRGENGKTGRFGALIGLNYK